MTTTVTNYRAQKLESRSSVTTPVHVGEQSFAVITDHNSLTAIRTVGADSSLILHFGFQPGLPQVVRLFVDQIPENDRVNAVGGLAAAIDAATTVFTKSGTPTGKRQFVPAATVAQLLKHLRGLVTGEA
jgi:hypothetical protein